jgi:phosphatidylserine/phosphatidylglycerophosphate/cardiolipin synthase-like enzyme
MAKKKKSKVTPQSLLMGIVGAIIIAVASYFGVDLSGILDTADEGTTTVQEEPAAPENLPEETTNNAGATGSAITISEGFGAEANFWQVYFTAPTRNDAHPADTCMGGIDQVLVDAVNDAQATLDIAVFEWENACLTAAVVVAHERGVQVRMVVDDEHTVEENEELDLLGEDAPFIAIEDAGIPWRDDQRSALMHNKFFIIDGQEVFTGSMNFTPRGTYTNNNNLLRLRSRRVVEAYQTEFNEMFEQEVFGPRGDTPNNEQFTVDGIDVRVIFSPDDPVSSILEEEIRAAQSEIRFMTFSFTLDEIGAAVLDQAAAGVDVSGIFETVGSQTRFSELGAMYCAGLDVFQDTNSETFHHKVFVIDRTTVLTGSFNISSNATESNDENMVIIRDPVLAELYLAEFERMLSQARTPDAEDFDC